MQRVSQSISEQSGERMNTHKQDTLRDSEIAIGTDAMKMRFLLLPITARQKDLVCTAVQLFLHLVSAYSISRRANKNLINFFAF